MKDSVTDAHGRPQSIHSENQCGPSVDAMTPVPLYADETVSDLLQQGLRLIQPRNGFRFGEDTVLLADFAARSHARQPGRSLRIADLGAGCGAATLLLAERLPQAVFLAVELETHSLSVLKRNIRLNQLTDRVTPFSADYSRWAPGAVPVLPPTSPTAGSFDLVIANPPYALPQATPASKQPHARSECTMSLESLIAAACCLLRPHGRLVLVHRCQRLTDVMSACRKAGVEPKQLRLVASLPERPPARFLLTAVRDARPGSLTVAVPLQIRDSRHELSEEVCQIYHNNPPLTPAQLMAGLVRVSQDWPGREQEPYDEAF